MFLKTQDVNTANELIKAGFKLIEKRFGYWVFLDTRDYDLTERQQKYVVRTNKYNM